LNVQVFFLIPEIVHVIICGEAEGVKHYSGLLSG
jgi:hypothetical protein